MSESMMELLRRKRATSTSRSIAMSEASDIQLHNKAEAAKEQLGNTTGISEQTTYIAQLSHHYYEMQAKYVNKRVVTRPKESKKRTQFWSRVQEACKASGVSPERYMKAQFEYFHIAFGTTPKMCNLSTDAAVERARAYEGKTTGKIVGNAIEAGVSLGSVFARCEKQVRDIMRAQKVTREEYYQRFVLTHLIAMPLEFLQADPVYRKVAKL